MNDLLKVQPKSNGKLQGVSLSSAKIKFHYNFKVSSAAWLFCQWCILGVL